MKQLIITALLIVGFHYQSFSQCVAAPVPNDACYNQVITADPFCCNTLWDGLCQSAYDACAAPCPVVAPVPNDACYNQVITNDSYCCNTAWDAVCQSAYDACAGSGTNPCSSITPLIGCGTSTGASLSGTGTWDIGACGFSTPGAELIFSFTATSSGIHSLNITSISGGFIDFMWVDAAAGCSTGAGWSCISDISTTGNYGAMNWTAGNTYYILLDAEGTGAYSVTFDVDCPNPGTPAVAGDCNVAIPVCTNLAFQVDPSGYGSIDELCTSCTSNPSTNPASANDGCLLSGELNSTWFTVNVAAGGQLEFSFGAPGGGNCYDWIMWSYDPNTCTNIINDTQAPVTCDWNSPCDSYTGMASSVPAGGYAGNFQPTMSVSTGDQYLICFSNYSSALTTVPLDFFGTADISCTLLPVELIEFSGNNTDGYNELNWNTAAEINCSHYVLERSEDGIHFQDFLQVQGAGTDLDGQAYRAQDFKPFKSITYYRLRQVDYNGDSKTSDIIAIATESTDFQFKIVSGYPNPANEQFHVQVLAQQSDALEITVCDFTGAVVYTSSVPSIEGMNLIEVPVKHLKDGMYMLRVKDERTKEADIIRFAVE